MSDQQPPMGPPEEMQQLAYLEGNWIAKGTVMVDPSTDQWMDYEATLRYSWLLGQGALRGEYASGLMGMDIKGHLVITYDRETSEWQSAWIDNIACRQVLYTGTHDSGILTVEGEDIRGGASLRTRVTTTKKSDSQLDWKMEMSADGGATWQKTAEAVYRRQ